MINTLIQLITGNWLRSAAIVVIVIGLAFAGCEIRGCIKAKQRLKEYQAAERIRQQDAKTDKDTEERKREIENMDNPDDFADEFNRLRQKTNR